MPKISFIEWSNKKKTSDTSAETWNTSSREEKENVRWFELASIDCVLVFSSSRMRVYVCGSNGNTVRLMMIHNSIDWSKIEMEIDKKKEETRALNTYLREECYLFGSGKISIQRHHIRAIISFLFACWYQFWKSTSNDEERQRDGWKKKKKTNSNDRRRVVEAKSQLW